ncbi:hypothetical protein [Flavihumibacter petaseus]|uniref:Uncharacterized protein n=1 Tax=Flavihumibacter petaseus NBRC 106054 TaxID=1220578 RepID=A0A0E9MYY4_9BACT|nr:hypothetical protein [Flavihumibacter petaseus]GAO42819.1 hypothetical protein FPE01S_01_18370 [Flavihumibacter petaseus NBRC 106054]
MRFYLFLLGLACLLAGSCSKSAEPPADSPSPQDKEILMRVFTAPGGLRDPETTQASLKITILKASNSNVHTEVVYDTLVRMRKLHEFPGPKEPMELGTSIRLKVPGHDLLSISYQIFYQGGQKWETISGNAAVPASNSPFHYDIKL